MVCQQSTQYLKFEMNMRLLINVVGSFCDPCTGDGVRHLDHFEDVPFAFVV